MTPLTIKVINRKNNKKDDNTMGDENDVLDNEVDNIMDNVMDKQSTKKNNIDTDLNTEDEDFGDLDISEEESEEESEESEESNDSEDELTEELTGGTTDETTDESLETTSGSSSQSSSDEETDEDSDFNMDELQSDEDSNKESNKNKKSYATVESIIAQSERSMNTFQNSDAVKIDNGTYSHKDITGGADATDIMVQVLSGGYKEEIDAATSKMNADNIYKKTAKKAAPFKGGYIKNVNTFKIIDAYPYVIKSNPSYN